ncbi:MAG TPA: ATP-binding cassette domain-containing protein [Cytophagaceae bacterium]|jgi:molybdate transport system ATP-binding protein|nr:ATP-binding cassette domain-containing protein [Cytophagaceae bacterium]
MFEIEVKKKLHASHGSMLLDVTLQIEQGKFASIYGKSGAGKTTLLKILAGLILPEEGFIKAASETWFSKEKSIHEIPQRRKIGFVFQDYALFPNMTLYENLTFVLPDKKNKKRLLEIMEIMELGALAHQVPAMLSGGQQQRCALARALVREPDLLLLDEPFSSLDPEMRYVLQNEIIRIHRHFGLTTFMISHDPSEIYRLSDYVIEMDLGKIIRQGTPSEVFQHKEISGKIQLTGEVLDVIANDIVYVVKVIVGNNLMNVVITKEEALQLQSGDKVLISTKAFNPVLMKL